MGALTPFFYTQREREKILDIFEMVSGVRVVSDAAPPYCVPVTAANRLGVLAGGVRSVA